MKSRKTSTSGDRRLGHRGTTEPTVTDDATDADAGQQEFALDVPKWDDTALVAGIRRGEISALREFCERFRPVLLDQVRRQGVPADEREDTVMEFLDDIAIKLTMGPLPYALPSFVVKSFRNRLIDQWRKAERVREAYASNNVETDSEGVVTGGCSEYSRRAARGGDGEDETQGAVHTLVAHLLESRTQGERDMLVWLANHVPLRDVAGWLGISYPAAKVRWCRLRAKLYREAAGYLGTLGEYDRHLLQRLLPLGAAVDDAETDVDDDTPGVSVTKASA